MPPGPGNEGGSPSPGEEDAAPQPPDTGKPGTARWSKAFDKRNCDAIAKLGPERGQQQLYEGLGHACRAVDGAEYRKTRWAEADTALRRVGDPTTCRDGLALRLLRDLVTAHQRAPNAEIRIVDSPYDSLGDACSSGGASSTQPSPSG